VSRGIWKNPAVPKSGWICVNFDDLGPEQSRDCGACGSTTLRYVHHLKHPDGSTLAVGKTCAARLEDDPGAAGRRETGAPDFVIPALRHYPIAKQSRMMDWLKNWNPGKKPDTIWRRVGTDFATVFRRWDGRYAGVYRDVFTRPHPTVLKAQLALYGIVASPDMAPDKTGTEPKVLPAVSGSDDPLSF